MNNKVLSLALILMGASTAFAQTGVIDVHPATNPGGKILTQEEATMGRYTRPTAVSARWDGNENVTVRNAEGTFNFNVKKKTMTAAEAAAPAQTPAMGGAPRGLSMQRTGAYTEGGSVKFRAADGTVETVFQGSYGIVAGETVSRSEFGINGGIFPAPSGNQTAFYVKDESKVTEFPLLDITTRTGSLVNIRYPMNGMTSENITLGIWDHNTKNTVWVKVTDFDDERYLTNISWSPDSKYVFIQVLNRPQHEMHLNMYRADNGEFVRTLLTEKNEKWVEPENPLRFIKDSYEFVYTTDNRDGYKNLYLCDTLGNIRRLTPAEGDVAYVNNDGKYVYYNSWEISPAERHLFRVKLGKKLGKPEQLTAARGWHSTTLSADFKYFIDSYTSFNNPGIIELRSTDGKLVAKLGENENPLKDYAQPEMVFGTVKSADGKFDNHYRLYKPLNFDPSKKYPVVVYVYGGPHTQLVNDSWLGSVRMWELLMAQKGYVVYVQDNRGTPYHGTEYEKAINGQCGQAEMADQMEGMKMLMAEPWVDASRIGVHGWSYGGFMTISLITNYPDVFKVGVAGGPVIDWKWYEVMYGERYMDNPETNPEGFEKTSLINKAKDLKGKLLICQGAIDNTVVWEHSLSFIQECIEYNIPVDYFPYPRSEHNVSGKWRVHLMDKVTDYFDTWL